MAAHRTTWSNNEDLFLRETGWTHMVSFSHPTWDPGFSKLHERPFFAEAEAACRVCVLSGWATISRIGSLLILIYLRFD